MWLLILRPSVVELVVFVVEFEIADEPSDYFVGQLPDIEIAVEEFVVELGVAASVVVQRTEVYAAAAGID